MYIIEEDPFVLTAEVPPIFGRANLVLLGLRLIGEKFELGLDVSVDGKLLEKVHLKRRVVVPLLRGSPVPIVLMIFWTINIVSSYNAQVRPVYASFILTQGHLIPTDTIPLYRRHLYLQKVRQLPKIYSEST